ncbi:MAG TPA: hypothetical protein VN673_05060, partial [Clostridia bacterium]|nr:hypothetical protein [Clostridia bacterium]
MAVTLRKFGGGGKGVFYTGARGHWLCGLNSSATTSIFYIEMPASGETSVILVAIVGGSGAG